MTILVAGGAGFIGANFVLDWLAVDLSVHNARQLWVQPDFAHGFPVTSESAKDARGLTLDRAETFE